jgi:hypothetical protein
MFHDLLSLFALSIRRLDFSDEIFFENIAKLGERFK